MDQPVRRRLNGPLQFRALLHYLAWPMALGLVVWVMLHLPLGGSLQAIKELRVGQWLGWVSLNLCIVLFLTWRWLVLIRALGLAVDLLPLLRIRQAGQVISFVTPGPQFGGEPLQVYWLWRRHSIPGMAALLAVGLDRFYELWINFAVLLIAVLTLLGSTSLTWVNWYAIAVVLAMSLSLLGLAGWLVATRPRLVQNWIRRLIKPWRHHPRLRQLQAGRHSPIPSLQQLTTDKRPELAWALLLSLGAWVGIIAEFWLVLGFVGIPVDPSTFVFLFTVIRLAFLMPLPGGVGSVEAALLWSFQMLSLPLTEATALILLMRCRDLLILLASAAVLPGLFGAGGRVKTP